VLLDTDLTPGLASFSLCWFLPMLRHGASGSSFLKLVGLEFPAYCTTRVDLGEKAPFSLAAHSNAKIADTEQAGTQAPQSIHSTGSM